MTDRIRISTGAGNRLGQVSRAAIPWEALCARLAEPLVDERYDIDAYDALPKEERDARKAHPGFFVAGIFKADRRKGSDLIERTMVVLDADELTGDTLAGIRDGSSPLCRYRFCVYSSRRHRPERPRVRIVVPLATPVPPADYGPLSRLTAALVDPTLDALDDCSFKPNQVMYMPSVCKGAEFVHFVNEGEVMVAADVLAGWDGDWNSLPRSARRDAVREPKAQAADPLTKPGLIGAFNRCFTIEHAIAEFDLPYEAGSADDRFTFTGGTSANGAIIYDDVFMWSNHYQDPAYGELLDAFHLVKVHRFEEMDEAEAFKAMLELAGGIEEVRADWVEHDVVDPFAEAEVVDESYRFEGEVDGTH